MPPRFSRRFARAGSPPRGYDWAVHPFDEMKSWTGFGVEDERRLRALWPLVAHRLPELSERFYAPVLAHPGAQAVLKDAAQVERLKQTLQRWTAELLQGPWDDAYYARREKIGRVHVDVRLPARYMFTAMHVMREALCEMAREGFVGSEAEAVCAAVARATDMDLAIMTGTFVEGRERAQLTTIQDLIVSHMPVTVLLLDGEGQVTAATRPSTRLFGDRPVVGRAWADALPTTLVQAGDVDAQMARALATGREITLPRIDVTLDNRERNFRITIVPLDHPEARVLLHLEELTETIRAESRLQRSESLAQLGALSAAVAHELRNPLAGISGAIQVIARSLPEDDRRKSVMEKVEQQVRRLNDLVTDLLSFARPTEARSLPVDLGEVARAVVDLLSREHPGVALSVEGAGRAQADPNLVQQVLLNLVLNGIQAQDGAGQVLLRVAGASIVVSDAGPGIPEGDEEKIFTPFFTTRTRGTGLGLAICRKAAGAMGGALTLVAGPLPGAAFALALQPPPESRPESSSASPQLSPE